MRLLRFTAPAAPLAFILALTAAAAASPTPAPPGPVTIAVTMNAPVFPYGMKQGFTVTGNTNGKKCDFSFHVSYYGTPVAPQGGQLPSTVTESAALPWTSIDLALPTSKGGNYTLVVDANPQPNACTGEAVATFVVEPQIGKLTGLNTSTPVVAVNEPITLSVSGQSYGYCSYTGAVVTQNTDGVAPVTLTQVPYQTNLSFTQPGAYVAKVDEIDVSGRPEGCTGHLQLPFTVIARPYCPTALESYQSADDSEFGCVVPPVSAGVFDPLPFTCPTGYNSFLSSGSYGTWYGCRIKAAPPLPLATLTGLLGAATKPAISGFLNASSAPLTSQPTITGLQLVVAGPGSLPRPNTNVFYAGEDFSVNVVGNIPNNGGYDPSLCGYTVNVESLATHQITNSVSFTEFNVWDIGKIPAPGEYSISVVPFGTANSWPPACLGKAERSKVTFYPEAAWVTGFELVGFGFHFGATDEGMPQFCQNCNSLFSPSHDSALLAFVPTIIGSTPGGTCEYIWYQTGGNQSNSPNNGAPSAVLFGDGHPALPASQAGPANWAPSAANTQWQTPNLTQPWWTEWSDSNNTVTVTVTDAPANWNTGRTPCNIVGGSISKTITFSDDPNAKPVKK